MSFGALLEPLSFLWRAGAILLSAFGLLGLSVSSLLLFVVLVARLDRFRLQFEAILERFREHFWCNFGSAFCERGFTCMGTHVSKVSLYLSFCFAVGEHLEK